jgi:hypothetical protein
MITAATFNGNGTCFFRNRFVRTQVSSLSISVLLFPPTNTTLYYNNRFVSFLSDNARFLPVELFDENQTSIYAQAWAYMIAVALV